MKFDEVAARIAGVPFTSPEKGKLIYDFVLETKPHQCLELGFAHGVSSCYIAAALHELRQGRLTTVDLNASRDREPNIEELLRRCGLEAFVTVVREKTGYNWFLKKQVEQAAAHNSYESTYDFCFVDGAHNWTTDGFAFFLVDKLLTAGGWIVFDDYSWTYAQNEARTGKSVTAGMHHEELSDEELHVPHVEAVFRNLVMPHPHYGNFKVLDDHYAYAQKTGSGAKTIHYDSSVSIKYRLAKLVRGLVLRSAR